MSMWTHVSGNIRVDDYSFFQGDRYTDKEIKKILGPMSTWEEPNDKCKLPMGSEGSLEYDIWTNPSESSLFRYNIAIYGDLRDFGPENIKEIEDWFSNLHKQFTPGDTYFNWRDAILRISCEDGTQEILYLDDNKESLEKIIISKGYEKRD